MYLLLQRYNIRRGYFMRNIILGTDLDTDCDYVAAIRIIARAHKNK